MCGQCAYIGPAKQWSYEYFKLAALMQDIHGRDNAGFAHVLPSGEFNVAKCSPITGSIVFDLFEYDQSHIIGSSLYELMCLSQDIPKQIEGNIVIAHSRKGSVGNDDIGMAQPVELPCGDFDLLLTHNGTIYNYEEILECLSIEDPVKNDSHAIALAIKHGKEKEFFELINGTATCMWVRSDMPTTIFACGITQDANSKSLYPTRPLHFTHLEDAIYISREKLPLSYIKGMHTTPENSEDIGSTYSIIANTIMSFYITDKGVAQYSRIATLERRPLLPVKHTSTTNSMATTLPPDFNNLENMTEVFASDMNLKNPSKTTLEYVRNQYYINGELVTTPYEIVEGKLLITSQTYVTVDGQLVYERAGRYYFDDGSRYRGTTNQLHVHYFLMGIMLTSRPAFEKLVLDHPEMNFLPIDLASSATHPVWIGSMNKLQYVSSKNLYHFVPAMQINEYSDKSVHGKFIPLYSNKVYMFKHGKVYKIKTINRTTAKKVWNTSLMELEIYNSQGYSDQLKYRTGEVRHSRKMRLQKTLGKLLDTAQGTEKSRIDKLLKADA
jgi:hypothetical protein